MLKFSEVSKRYRGSDTNAVDGISFSLPSATIMGLLGPNGAGKTTSMKMAGGLLYPSSGEIEIAGVSLTKNHRQYRNLVGIHLGGDFGFYNRSGVLENLEFFASLAGVKRGSRRHRCQEVLAQVGLQEKMTARVEVLSHGMKQRLHLARAIVANPPVILLDEPTSGLDPSQAVRIRQLIAELPKSGVSVLLSTHQMTEAYQLADTVNIINHGKLLVSATPDRLLALSGKKDLEAAYLWVIEQDLNQIATPQ